MLVHVQRSARVVPWLLRRGGCLLQAGLAGLARGVRQWPSRVPKQPLLHGSTTAASACATSSDASATRPSPAATAASCSSPPAASRGTGASSTANLRKLVQRPLATSGSNVRMDSLLWLCGVLPPEATARASASTTSTLTTATARDTERRC